MFAPQFRLVIGTAAISTKLGSWERDAPKILEIATHPSTSSFAAIKGSSGSGSVRGAVYAFVVGLTDRINCGQQSVTPRRFQYTGAGLTCEVTTHAAELAMQMPIGTLSRLQVRFMDGGESSPTDFETIHIGTFQGVKWNGDRYILSFGDALQAAEQRSTDDGTFRSAERARYDWFAGIGTREFTTKTALTDFTGGGPLDLTQDFDATERSRLGHAYKNHDSFGGFDFHHGEPIIPEPGSTRFHNIWVAVTNTDNEATHVLFGGLFGDGAGDMRLGNASSRTLNSPGGGASGGDLSAGIGIGSKVRTLFLLHGTPVTEIVNSIYTMGYHPEMVCGLFGENVAEADESLNILDIEKTHKEWNEQWTSETGFLPTRGANVPLKVKFTAPSSTGYSDIKKVCARFAVFPRFKMGGYSVGAFIQQRFDTTPRGDHSVIQRKDIEAAEWEQMGPQSRGLYAKLQPATSDNAADQPDTTTITTFNIDGSSPIIPEFTLSNSECSPGQQLGESYFQWFRDVVFQNWFTLPRSLVTLRLCGLRFAELAPGDRVDVFMGEAEPGKGYGYGFRDSTLGEGQHVLNSIIKATSPLQGQYFVLSTKVDWVGIKVHLTLSRIELGPTTTFKERVISGELTAATGLPQRDIDPDN